MAEIKLKNGNIIKTVDSEYKNVRGKRANMLEYWSDELGCFVRYDGINQKVNNIYSLT